MRRSAFGLLLPLVLALPARAETLTVSLTTPSGTLTQTRTVSDADETRLLNAIQGWATGQGQTSPNAAQSFSLLVDRWVAVTVQFVRDQESAAAASGVTSIGITP